MRVIGAIEVTCSVERSAAVAVAAALDAARCRRLPMALSALRRAFAIRRGSAEMCALLVLTLALMWADGRLRRGKRSISAAWLAMP